MYVKYCVLDWNKGQTKHGLFYIFFLVNDKKNR